MAKRPAELAVHRVLESFGARRLLKELDAPWRAWIPVGRSLPELKEDYYSWKSSDPVLATDGRVIYVSVLSVANDEPDVLQWHQLGRDSYAFKNVTHWMPLPPLP